MFDTPQLAAGLFIFDAAHKFLLPRAVGYSAGLINYFFRGNIDLVEDDNDPTLWVIENSGTEDMQGTFELYYEAKDGTRKLVQGAQWNKTVIKGMKSEPVDISPPSDAAKPREYLLVFHGAMGQEPQGDGTGAVVAKKVVARVVQITRTDAYVDPDDGIGGLGIVDFYLELSPGMERRLRADPRSISVVSSEGGSLSNDPIFVDKEWPLQITTWGWSTDFYWQVTTVQDNGIIYWHPEWFLNNLDNAPILRANGLEVQSHTYADITRLHSVEVRFRGKKLYAFSYQLRPRADLAYDAVISNPLNIQVKDADDFKAVRTVAAPS